MSDIIEPISFPPIKFVPKAWGSEQWIINNDLYCAKILSFGAGRSFSNHFHFSKIETWYVLVGSLILEYFDLSNASVKTKTVSVGDVIHVPRGNPHKLTALIDSVIWETSTHHDDFDSYKIGKGDSQK